jgi:hypothetical protein
MYLMTISTFSRLVSLQLSAIYPYSTRKSSIEVLSSLEKYGRSLDLAEGIAAVPY